MLDKNERNDILAMYLQAAYSQPVSVENSLLLALQWCGSRDNLVPVFRRQTVLGRGSRFWRSIRRHSASPNVATSN